MIQRLLNLLYRYPKAALHKVSKFGGILNYQKMLFKRRQMERSAYHLPPVKSEQNGLPIYFLTGKRYLYQTLFCITSLNKHTKEAFHFILVDDGTFDEQIITRIHKQLPGATVITEEIITNNLQKVLPRHQFPVLWRKRDEYPHIKKLTDVHTIPGNRWKLVLDSDMLFYKYPMALVSWLKQPEAPLHMVDCTESYGYPVKLMEQLANAPIPLLLNVGAIGLESETLNWSKMEEWITVMEDLAGKSYYLEQALSAMLIAGQKSVILSAQDYLVNPSTFTEENSGVLHHYVDLSKKHYYNTAWKNFAP